ncbi:hypothetical protein GW950_00835 [Candidatus Wolfebacteria bacterium]|nr:hypothetical protein [Candidatus Wolfebacteria bacterium]
MDEKLKKYIEDLRRSGQSDDEIKQTLLAAGWNEVDIGDITEHSSLSSKWLDFNKKSSIYSIKILREIILFYLPILYLGMASILYFFRREDTYMVIKVLTSFKVSTTAGYFVFNIIQFLLIEMVFIASYLSIKYWQKGAEKLNPHDWKSHAKYNFMTNLKVRLVVYMLVFFMFIMLFIILSSLSWY